MDLAIPQPGDPAYDFTQGDGYDRYGTNPAVFPVLFPESVNIIGADVTTVYPSTSAVGVGYAISVSQTVLEMRMDKGWNAWARSLDPIQVGNFYQSTVPPNVEAAFFAIGQKGYDGRSIGNFQHGIMVDVGGVTVRENGIHKAGLKSLHGLDSKIKIFRDESGDVIYVVTTGTETTFYKSQVSRTENVAFPLYVYAYLYSGGDRVETNEFLAGKVQFASV